jgi:hypothetical protein
MLNDGEINLNELNNRPTDSSHPANKEDLTNKVSHEEKDLTKNKVSVFSFKWCCLNGQISWKITFVFLCVCCFFQNLVTSGVATVILSTIEREFFWSSTQSGLFLALFELAAFIASPIFGFLGKKQFF